MPAFHATANRYIPTQDCVVCGEPEHFDEIEGWVYLCPEAADFERFEPVHLREL